MKIEKSERIHIEFERKEIELFYDDLMNLSNQFEDDAKFGDQFPFINEFIDQILKAEVIETIK